MSCAEKKYCLSLCTRLISIPPFVWSHWNKKSTTEDEAPVQKVMQAIMILQGKEPTCAEAKSQLGERQWQDGGMTEGRKLKR